MAGRCSLGSVGAIVRRDSEFLVLYRKSIPVGLAGVAGHVDEGESPEQALERELFEEAGVIAKKMRLVFHEVLNDNPCGRGFTSHEWRVFEVTDWEGEPVLKEPKNHTFVKFMRPAEITEYMERGDMDSAWSRIFKRTRVLADVS